MSVYTLLLITSLFSCSNAAILCINNVNNSCVECDASYSSEYVVQKEEMKQDFTLKICSDSVKLVQLFHVQNLDSVRLTGEANATSLLVCSGNSSGLKFTNISYLEIKNVEIKFCGALHNSTSLKEIDSNLSLKTLFRSSIYIVNSSDVSIVNVIITSSNGTGLAIIDTNGRVEIKDSKFHNNKVSMENKTDLPPGVIPRGGGVYVEFTYCTPVGGAAGKCTKQEHMKTSNSSYSISGCSFSNNVASTVNADRTTYFKASGHKFQGLGRGGGLCIFIRGYAEMNTISVSNCNFTNNSAIFGGGMYAHYRDSPKLNSVTVKNSLFENNECLKYGGGGINLGLFYSNDHKPENNSFLVSNCMFLRNKANYGGGSRVFSSQSLYFSNLRNLIMFEECTWDGNIATYGTAVDLSISEWDTNSYGFLPTPHFKNCSFISNIANFFDAYTKNNKGKAVFFSDSFSVNFTSITEFDSNTGSALYLLSSTVQFSENSNVKFTNNRGIDGGAIAMLGHSVMRISDSSEFFFSHNKAKNRGGAIFFTTPNSKDYSISRSCFIQYIGTKRFASRGIKFIFSQNVAGGSEEKTTEDFNTQYGHSIFAATLFPCYSSCTEKRIHGYNETFDCIADFQFENNASYEISTLGYKIMPDVNATIPMHIIPGKLSKLPITLINELSKEVQAIYRIILDNSDSNLTLDASFTYISDKWIRLFGNPGKSANVTLTTTDVGEVTVSFEVEVQQCPPGYILNQTRNIKGNQNTQCVCSSSTSNMKYEGIYRCDESNFQAFLRHGYWIGYTCQCSNKENDLLTGYCPRGYCFKERIKQVISLTENVLPNDTDVKKLDRLICGEFRTGILCGRCRGNYTSYFHSDTFSCGSSQQCSNGWIWYILSEIIPATCLFLLIILLDVNFTTGGLNSLVFYFHISNTLPITANDFIRFPHAANALLIAYKFIIGAFDLNFFNIEQLSFCLWKEAQALDIVAFKYVTVLYSLMLVVIIIFILRVCSNQCTSKVCRIKFSAQHSIIHGLSGFLIICYSECTKISLILLTPGGLSGKGNARERADLRNVVFYDGELNFFQGKHLLYALPALFFIVIIGLVPPMLMIVYPLCYRVFGWLKISESRSVKLLCQCIPLEKLKPLFDSFQSSFKDEYRFFSGLYFLYRLLALLIFAFSHSLTSFYTTIQGFFLLVLSIHAIIQPYKLHRHNILDALVLTNLSIINILSFYNYQLVDRLSDYNYFIKISCAAQIIFLYLPLIYLLLLVVKKMISQMKRCIQRKEESDEYSMDRRLTMSLSLLDSRETLKLN